MTWFHVFLIAVPKAPESVKVTEVGQDNASLEWRPPLDNGGSRVISYIIEKMRDNADSWTKVATVDAYKTHYNVLELEEGKGYYFSVSAENEAGVGKRCETEKPARPKRPLGKSLTCNRTLMTSTMR